MDCSGNNGSERRGGLGERGFWVWAFVSRTGPALVSALASFVGCAVAIAQTGGGQDGGGAEFFERKVRPVLVEHCVSCHGPDKQKGGLRLDSPEFLRAGGDGGAVVEPGAPDQSRLILAVRHTDDSLKMPPKKKLPESVIGDLTQWVRGGANLPGGGGAAATSPTRRGEFQISDRDRQHWAFRPVRRPNFPAGGDVEAHPIDRFIDAALAARGIAANPSATRRELIRRATYDLTGLPPTPEEVETFERDASPRAWERVVDRLLASQHYGEKWGRHWLDLVRFAESNSYERDGAKPHAWKYRDYVIRAFNSDKPYDQFLREQIAGDEFAEPDADALTATGFYRLGIWDDEPADRELARYDALDDIVTTIGQGVLGLTVDCARCHHHKIDPISQHDYYRLVAFLQNINHYKNGGPTDELPLPMKREAGGGTNRVEAEKVLGVTERDKAPEDTFVLMRGNPNLKGDKVEPGYIQVVSGAGVAAPKATPKGRSSGRRTLLADWITSGENPLTSRVIANRLWQHHFGRGIVRSPNNFGLQGDAPTHPELLDWLAAETVARGWRLKAMHRLILTSRAYQRSSGPNVAGMAADPVNNGFWRFDLRRLAAEEIRDTILAISGNLNRRMYGPGIYVDLPKEVLAGQSQPGSGWGKSPVSEQCRRSVYIHSKRSLIPPILESFDVAETDRSAPVRFATVQPTQALGMFNGAFLREQSRRFAARLAAEAAEGRAAKVILAFRLATGRTPGEAEVQRGVGLMERLEMEGLSKTEALEQFCLLVLNLNETIYVD